MMYDYLVVGSGLYGAIFAHEAKAHGKSVLVVDKRPNIAGNIYTENIEGINVHKYGAHIFHTNNKKVWNYITQFAEFNRFTNSPVANYKGELYSLPFNMYTFNKMWGVVTPEEAAAKIEEQRKEITGEPKNLEEQAISLVGWSTALFALKMRFSISPVSKAMLQSTTQIVKHLGRESSSISGLSLARMKTGMICQKLLSAANIAANGNLGMSRIILSMMQRTVYCILSIKSWQRQKVK